MHGHIMQVIYAYFLINNDWVTLTNPAVGGSLALTTSSTNITTNCKEDGSVVNPLNPPADTFYYI
jgi:hypothetical protein